MWPDGKETKAMVQQTARDMTAIVNNVSEVTSSSVINPNPGLLFTPDFSEPAATGPSKVALISRSIHKSHYPVWSSAPGDRKLVLPRQSFRGVDVHRLTALDQWQACVIHPYTLINSLI